MQIHEPITQTNRTNRHASPTSRSTAEARTRQTADGLLRELAFVFHATRQVRKSMAATAFSQRP
jgi:hypothetical protein